MKSTNTTWKRFLSVLLLCSMLVSTFALWNISSSAAPEGERPVDETKYRVSWSFETGVLSPFTIEEGSFGESVIASWQSMRDDPEAGRPMQEGRFYLSTEEVDGTFDRTDPSYTGTIQSPSFRLIRPAITLMVAGTHHESIYVAVCAEDGEILAKAEVPKTGRRFQEVSLDLGDTYDETAVYHIRIVDHAGDGFIAVDHIVLYGSVIPSGYTDIVWSFEDGTTAPFTTRDEWGHPIIDRDFDRNDGVTPINKDGRYYLSTVEVEDPNSYNEAYVGSFRSPDFLLNPDHPTVQCRIAGGSSPDNYVAICDAVTGKELAKQTPPVSGHPMHACSITVPEYQKGQKVYLKIVDGLTAGWGFITVDDFRFSGYMPGSDDTYEFVRWSFENGTVAPFVSKADTKPMVLNRKDEQYGRWFLSTETGATMKCDLRSPEFILDPSDPTVRFRLGGSVDERNYVAICDALTGKELVKQSPEHETLTAVELTVENYQEKAPVFLKITDGQKSEGGFITVDDFTATMAVTGTPFVDHAYGTSSPSLFYDFAREDVIANFQNTMQMECTYAKEYTTFTATADDPYTWLGTTQISVSDARVVRIAYRTAVEKIGEFYVTRSDNGAMGAPGTTFSMDWTSSGEWEDSVFPCSAWNTAPESTTLDIIRFDPLQGNVRKDESIDVAYIAFFPTVESALSFDVDGYRSKLADEEKKQEEIMPEVDWPDPVHKDMTTTDEDFHDGTLKYTVSEDGETVTITYKINGKDVSYTVPNRNNYLSGGYAGVDDLNRPLYRSEDVGIYGENGEHYVGLFYLLWQGEHGDVGVFDLQKILEADKNAAMSVSKGQYGPVGAMHWFAEPLYGYYYGNDAWVQRKHAELLCNANIDFLYLDATNSYPYLRNAKQLMGILHELNEQGYDAPQIVFYTNTAAPQTVKQIYQAIYQENLYPDTWFCIDGKPVIIGPDSANIDGFFHMKANQWPNEPEKVNGWPWMDWSWPQRIFRDEQGRKSAMSVSVAQHSGTCMFSDSSLYDDFTNRGRSFGAETVDKNSLRDEYTRWQKNPSLTMQGRNFQAQWDHAIKSDVTYVLVTGWNEWVAQRQDGQVHRKDPDKVCFVDTSSMEFSRDTEMMRGGYFDNYYMQLLYNVQKLKGTAPTVVQDLRKPINVTEGFDQWAEVPVTYRDTRGDTVIRDAIGFGHTPYQDNSGRNDIVSAKVTSDAHNVYFYVETVADISMFDSDTTWMQLFVDTDSHHETGWYGYDYIINAGAKDAFTTTVSAYNGNHNEFSFKPVGDVSYRVKDNHMMLAVPLDMLGIRDYREIHIQFKWADSETRITTMEQFYTDGDVAPLGRLNFVYQNYLPGVSVPDEPTDDTTESETDSVTETVTEPVTETTTESATEDSTEPTSESPVDPADTTPETTDAGEKKGCRSSVAPLAFASLLVMAAGCIVKRRKNADHS